jgi:probable DNA metabolism protein
MRTWLYDGSFDGLLTTLSVLFEKGEEPGEISRRSDSLPLFGEAVDVFTDTQRAAAFLDALREKTSSAVARHVVRVGMADRISAEMPLYRFVRLALAGGADVISYHAHPDVRIVNEIAASVGREIHRLKGLLRFRETQDGWLWAPMAPDHNVAAAVAQHFHRRMPGERWMIHDVARRLVVAWDGKDWQLKDGADSRGIVLSAREKEVQEWWRAFYREIAIAERRNLRLQAQNMPRRYWGYLVEKGF